MRDARAEPPHAEEALRAPEWAASAASRADAFLAEVRRAGATARPRRGALRVLTWNVQLLPGVFPGQAGDAASLVRRARRIAARLRELCLATRVDCVCLQEVWHDGAARALLRHLADVLPHAHRPDAFCGLVTLWRRGYALAHAHFRPFDARAGVEGAWFTKGVSVVTLVPVQPEPPDRPRPVPDPSPILLLLNTHTQSDFWRPGATVRARQFPVVLDALRRSAFAATPLDAENNTPLAKPFAVLCGDLNVHADSHEYLTAMRALGNPRDPLRGNTDARTFPIGRYVHGCDAFGLCGGSSGYRRVEPETRLDYVLDLGGWAAAATEATNEEGEVEERERGWEGFARAWVLAEGMAEGDEGEPLSDHAPVFAAMAR